MTAFLPGVSQHLTAPVICISAPARELPALYLWALGGAVLRGACWGHLRVSS